MKVDNTDWKDRRFGQRLDLTETSAKADFLDHFMNGLILSTESLEDFLERKVTEYLELFGDDND